MIELLHYHAAHGDEREFAYTGGAEQALEQVAGDGWTVISVKRDWAPVS